MTVVSATGLKNKKLMGAQDVSFSAIGMQKARQNGPTLEDCGVNATFNQTLNFPCKVRPLSALI